MEHGLRSERAEHVRNVVRVRNMSFNLDGLEHGSRSERAEHVRNTERSEHKRHMFGTCSETTFRFLHFSMLWKTPFSGSSASLVLKFEISASKLVGSIRPRIFSTLKRNFSIFDFFDFWETPF